MRYLNPKVLLLLLSVFSFSLTSAQSLEDEDRAAQEKEVYRILDSVDATIKYQTGSVPIKDIASLNIPATYKFVPADKATWILSELWGNPKRDDILGMIVPGDYKVSSEDAWAFIVTYEEDGYVKDEDADDIDYAEMLKEMQGSEAEVNKSRAEQGYEEVHILDWAATPFYDKDRKILHWAKKMRFGPQQEGEDLTLNYDVRILGRKGVLSLNAVGTMSQLGEINKHIPDVLSIATFTDGNKYSDFNPSMDKVAAYTIGGLIAGKLIAKTGLLILLLKNIKLILLAMFGGLGLFRKKIAGLFRRKQEDKVYEVTELAPQELPAPEADTNPNEKKDSASS